MQTRRARDLADSLLAQVVGLFSFCFINFEHI